jgi:hypothetical protein
LPLDSGWVVCGGVLFRAVWRERWFWLAAWAFWLVLAAPCLAQASTAGFCDERGASAIAPPIVKLLPDERLGPRLPSEPALCKIGAGLSCDVDEGRPLGPQASDASFVEAIEAAAVVARLKAPWVEPGWPAPAEASGPSGWPPRVEHPPRA